MAAIILCAVLFVTAAMADVSCDKILDFLQLKYPKAKVTLHANQNGCTITFLSKFTSNRADFDLRDYFQTYGYKEDINFSADGPDGTQFVYTKDKMACKANANWDFYGLNAPQPKKYDLQIKCFAQ